MRPFLQGKKSLPAAALQVPIPKAILSHAGVVSSAEESHPNIEVVKEGEKVVRLVITCVCGERVEVECLYRPGS
jgi:hypothetical protein